MTEESNYDDWINSRRDFRSADHLADRIMSAVEERGVQHKSDVRLADRLNESLVARLATCLAALLVGCLPFLFVAYVSQSLAF